MLSKAAQEELAARSAAAEVRWRAAAEQYEQCGDAELAAIARRGEQMSAEERKRWS